MKKDTDKTDKHPKIGFRMLAKRLVDQRCAEPPVSVESSEGPSDAAEVLEPDFDMATEAEDSQDEQPITREHPHALTAIVGAAFRAAVSPATLRQLQHGQVLAAVVSVPSPDWVGPIATYFKATFGSRWNVEMRDGSNRIGHLASVGNGDVSRHLRGGLCVVGIAADATLLPRALVAAADITIRVPPPAPATLRAAITKFAARAPKAIPDGVGAGLDLHEIASAFRPGTGPDRIVRRLSAATAVVGGDAEDERLPVLADAVEWGPAREFGMQLAAQVAAYRRQEIGWDQLQKGACLVSEPGCGKGIFVRSLARACQVPIVFTSCSSWFKNSPFLDETIRSMREVFERSAALANPCAIAFIDEIDAVPNRYELNSKENRTSNKDYWLPLITDLLLRLDSSVSSRRGVIAICATNNANGVDPALLRPGRFERMIRIDRPDAAGVANMLRFHAPELAQRDLEELSTMMDRSTGAEVMATVREARGIARNAGQALAVQHLRSALVNPCGTDVEADWRVCLHEAGHAACALALNFGSLLHCAVGARLGASHRTVLREHRGDHPTRSAVEDHVTFLLAGRSAEGVLLKTGRSIGGGGDPASDIGLGTELISSLHSSWGLGDTVAYLGSRREAAETIRYDRELRDLVEGDLARLQKRADAIVRSHRAAVVAIAESLRAKRYLSGDAVRAIFAAHAPAGPRKHKGGWS